MGIVGLFYIMRYWRITQFVGLRINFLQTQLSSHCLEPEFIFLCILVYLRYIKKFQGKTLSLHRFYGLLYVLHGYQLIIPQRKR
jgi:hypothetical protein